ncbi:MAG: LysM peptidoglycan-binding domain-containing protein [Synergistaceae bacterium]|nr:LysM peptidoglycan-binding domain-containing protein [Synergistaceae bacterium]
MSRYDWSVLYVDAKNGDFYGTRQPLRLREHSSDTFHTVSDTDSKRIDLIAWKYYRDVSLWWIIAEFNNISNPLEILPGTTLRIPTYERVQMKVLS